MTLSKFKSSSTSLSTLLILILLTALSFLLPKGYLFASGDHFFYLPAIMRTLDPSLFPGDLMLSIDLISLTYFDEILLWAMKLFSLSIDNAAFLVSVITRLIYFFAIYTIAFHISGKRSFALMAVLPFISSISARGPGIPTFDSIITARTISLALNLAALAFLFKGRRAIAAVLLGAGLLLNILTALPFFIFFYIDTFLLSRNEKGLLRKPEILASVVIPAIAFFYYLLTTEIPDGALFSAIDANWESIIRTRDYYIFISTWTWITFPILFISAAFFLVGREALNQSNDKLVRTRFTLLFLIPLFLTVLSFITTDLLKLHFFAQAMLPRSLLLWKIFNTLLLAYLAYRSFKETPEKIFYNFTLAALLIIFILPPLHMGYNLESFTLVFGPLFIYLWINERKGGGDKLTLPPLLAFLIIAACFSYFILLPVSVVFIYLLVAVGAAGLTFSLIVRYREDLFAKGRGIALIAIVAVITIIIKASAFHTSAAYMKDRNFMEACGWIVQNTAVTDTFITEPFMTDGARLRVACARSTFFTYKDGGHVIYTAAYATDWNKRLRLIAKTITDAKKGRDITEHLKTIRALYGTDYILSSYELGLASTPLFKNNGYLIYRLP